MWFGGCCPCGQWRRAHFWPRQPFMGLLPLAILKVLREQPLHGSEVLRALKEKFGVEVSSPAVYSALRKLEAAGLVTSTWDTSVAGPARRVYRITEEGLAYLEESVEWRRKLQEFAGKLLE